jgi:hypothetical protein
MKKILLPPLVSDDTGGGDFFYKTVGEPKFTKAIDLAFRKTVRNFAKEIMNELYGTKLSSCKMIRLELKSVECLRLNELLAATGLKATEMNVGRSVAEWNPGSIVAWVCEKVCASLVLCFVIKGSVPCHCSK